MTHLRQPVAWFAAVAMLIFGAGVFAGFKAFAPHAATQPTMNAQTILTALHDRGFLVTQTYVFDTPIVIERSTGSAFKDFFLGQTIEARGTMEVNMGIDLAQVREEDIVIDRSADTIQMTLPGATLFNTKLVGPIELKNRQGILKRLLDSDDGYNDALSALSAAAEEAARKPELVQRTDERAREDVRRLLQYITRGNVVEVKTE
jgi:hypothetical protein